MKVREVIRMLESDGWYQVRMKGSHRPNLSMMLKLVWLLYRGNRKTIWHLGHWAAS